MSFSMCVSLARIDLAIIYPVLTKKIYRNESDPWDISMWQLCGSLWKHTSLTCLPRSLRGCPSTSSLRRAVFTLGSFVKFSEHLPRDTSFAKVFSSILIRWGIHIEFFCILFPQSDRTYTLTIGYRSPLWSRLPQIFCCWWPECVMMHPPHCLKLWWTRNLGLRMTPLSLPSCITTRTMVSVVLFSVTFMLMYVYKCSRCHSLLSPIFSPTCLKWVIFMSSSYRITHIYRPRSASAPGWSVGPNWRTTLPWSKASALS